MVEPFYVVTTVGMGLAIKHWYTICHFGSGVQEFLNKKSPKSIDFYNTHEKISERNGYIRGQTLETWSMVLPSKMSQCHIYCYLLTLLIYPSRATEAMNSTTTTAVLNSTWCDANFKTATIHQLCACGVQTCCEPGKCSYRSTKQVTTHKHWTMVS